MPRVHLSFSGYHTSEQAEKIAEGLQMRTGIEAIVVSCVTTALELSSVVAEVSGLALRTPSLLQRADDGLFGRIALALCETTDLKMIRVKDEFDRTHEVTVLYGEAARAAYWNRASSRRPSAA